MKLNKYIAALSFTVVFVLLKFTPLKDHSSEIIQVSIYLIGFILTIYFSKEILRNDWQKFKSYKWYKYLFILASFTLIFAILKTIRYILPFIIDSNDVPSETNQENIEYSLIFIILTSLPALLAPFYEELTFRNNLFYNFRSKKTLYIPMLLLSSILFGLIHYYNFNSIIATIPYMFIGLYFGIIYHFKKNIFFVILPHLLLNWMNIFLGIIGYILIKTNSI